MPERALVVGGSGFIGAAIVMALRDCGCDVRTQRAPRLSSIASTVEDLERELLANREIVDALKTSMRGATIVVNAAGVADAASSSAEHLLGANALLPRVIGQGASEIGARRFIHVSSAGVQGRLNPLDESRTVAPFSLYTRSKALAEQSLATLKSAVSFRPTSVHGPDRSISHSLVKLARSRIASVAGAGDYPTPQVLVQNVGSAVAFVAMHGGPVPPVVLQPWEGLTAVELMRVLGRKEPKHIPTWAARAVVRTATVAGRNSAKASANSRRLEMLWFGQQQLRGWLEEVGWIPPLRSLEYWRELGELCQLASAN